MKKQIMGRWQLAMWRHASLSATKLLLAAALSVAGTLLAETPAMRNAGGGNQEFDNGLIRFVLAGKTGMNGGIADLVLLPSSYMSDKNRVYNNFFGEVFDSAAMDGISGGTVPLNAMVLAPLAKGVSSDGSILGFRQEYNSTFRFTRTTALHADRSVVDIEYDVENLTDSPVAGGFRMFSAPFPGALTGTTDKNTSVFMPLETGVLEIDQNLYAADYMKLFKDCKFLFPLWWEAGMEPDRHFATRKLPTAPLKENWTAEINRNNGSGIVIFAQKETLLGFYNDPRTTLETVLRAHAFRKGKPFRTKISLGAFRLPAGEKPIAANELFLTTAGGILPLFAGTLESGGKKYDVTPETFLKGSFPGPVAAYGRQGGLIGKFDGQQVEWALPDVKYVVPEKPVFQGAVYDPDEAAVRAFLEKGGFTVYCSYENDEATQAKAKRVARLFGVGYARHLPEGPILMIGNASVDDAMRSVGYMHNSVTDRWPEAGRGAIRHFPVLELGGQPGVVIAGRDAAGLEKALDVWEKRSLRLAKRPTGWTAARVPNLTKVFRHYRPAADAAKEIKVIAARGEYESAQLAFVPFGDIANLAVVTAPLVNRATGKEMSRRFLTGARRANGHVRVRWTGYFPYEPQPGQKDYPDPLFDRQPTVLKAGETQGIWLTFMIPESAEPGVYTSSVTLTAAGRTEVIPVEVTVRAFALPRNGMMGEAYTNLAGLMEAGRELQNGIISAFATDMVEHGMRMLRIGMPCMFRVHASPEGKFAPMCGKDFGPFEVSHDGKILLDCSEFDRVHDRFVRHTHPFDCCYVVHAEDFMWQVAEVRNALKGRHPDRGGNKLLNNLYMEEVLTMFHDHLVRRGLDKKVYFGIGDEPSTIDFWLEDLAKAARNAGLQTTTAHGSADLRAADPGACALWKPIYGSYNDNFMKKAKSAGAKTAFYNCGPPPTTSINAPGCEWRNYLWLAAKYDVDMVSWWGIQNWPAGSKADVWRNYYGHWNYVIYPEHPVNKPFVAKGKGWVDHTLIGSIRWETLRDGMEDANYVWLLRSLMRQANAQGKTAEASAAQKALDGLFARNWPHHNVWNVPEGELLKARETVASEIEKLQAALPR